MVVREPIQEQIKPRSRANGPRFWPLSLRSSSVPIKGKRRGFLPFETNPWGRVFVSTLLTIAIHLLWMRFLEDYISLTVATILTLIMTGVIFVRG
jgi:predicted small integral membrane protein